MQVLGIAIKGGKRAPMQEITEVKITESSGLEGDFRGRGGMMRKRQVTVLCVHQWRKACQELCVELPWHTRRANLFVDCPSKLFPLCQKLRIVDVPDSVFQFQTIFKRNFFIGF